MFLVICFDERENYLNRSGLLHFFLFSFSSIDFNYSLDKTTKKKIIFVKFGKFFVYIETRAAQLTPLFNTIIT